MVETSSQTVQDIAVCMQHAEKQETSDPVNNTNASDHEVKDDSELSDHGQGVDSTSSEVKLVVSH